MGLLDKLKSLFRSDSNSQSARSPPEDETTGTEPDVTIEREPSAESEHAVKGTDQSPESQSTAEATETASTAATTEATAPDAEVDEPTQEATADTTEETVAESSEEATADATEETQEATTEEATADATEETPAEPDEPAASVQEIKGIGPTYTERLEVAGIETVSDLAASDAATVAEAAEATEGRAADWIERAKAF
jgi:predicted flap endonuclease-1-like 5' DNA nuclease